jgi:hypothetical protein
MSPSNTYFLLLVFHIKEIRHIHDIRGCGVEVGIWVQVGDSNRGCRKFPIEVLHNSYPSPNIIRAIKSPRMRGTGHVECRGGEMKE